MPVWRYKGCDKEEKETWDAFERKAEEDGGVVGKDANFLSCEAGEAQITL